MATKKVLYFIAGNAPTVAEASDIAWLNAKFVPPYQGLVRSILADTEYGTSLEACDYCAGANIPTDYAGVPVLTIPGDGQPDAVVIGPAALSFVHTSVSQLTAFIKNADGTLTDVTTDSKGAWTSGTPGTATIGLHTGLLTGVAAGTTLVTFTYTPAGKSPVTKTLTVTCS